MADQQIRRVYFLGAGASKAFHPGFPIASQLTLEHLLQPNSYDDGVGPRTAIPALEGFLNTHREFVPFVKQPLETILGKLEVLTEPYWPYVNCVVCLLRRLKCPANWADLTLTRWLRRVREQKAVVITTNYDTVIEWTLVNEGTEEYSKSHFVPVGRDALHWIDYGIPEDWRFPHTERQTWPRPPEHSILYLKLHGSVSWSYCAECQKYNLDPIHSYAAEDAMTEWQPCPHCGKKKRKPVLVAPTETKNYEDKAIQQIWSRASESLGNATEIIFAGFSLNPFDGPVHELLKKAYKTAKTSKVLVVSPDASQLADRYQTIYGAAVAPVDTSWKTYLEGESEV